MDNYLTFLGNVVFSGFSVLHLAAIVLVSQLYPSLYRDLTAYGYLTPTAYSYIMSVSCVYIHRPSRQTYYSCDVFFFPYWRYSLFKKLDQNELEQTSVMSVVENNRKSCFNIKVWLYFLNNSNKNNRWIKNK